MRRRLLAREPWREEAQFVTASGDKLPVSNRAYPCATRRGGSRVSFTFCRTRASLRSPNPDEHDVYESRRGLPNRNLFHNRLSLAMGRRAAAVMASRSFRLTSITSSWLNDSLGHDAGDELLRQVAARMRACLRETDHGLRAWAEMNLGAILVGVLDPGTRENRRQAARRLLRELRAQRQHAAT